MTKTKPREWWLRPWANGELTVRDADPDLEFAQAIHVVEHSALTDALAELAKARQENEELMREDYWQSRYKAAQAEVEQLQHRFGSTYAHQLEKEVERLKFDVQDKASSLRNYQEMVGYNLARIEKQSAIIGVLAEALEFAHDHARKPCDGECIRESAKDALEKYEKHKQGRGK